MANEQQAVAEPREVRAVTAFVYFIHKSLRDQLCRVEPRWKWQDAYREWRLAGKPDMCLSEILDKFSPGPLLSGRVGTMNGFVIAEQAQ